MKRIIVGMIRGVKMSVEKLGKFSKILRMYFWTSAANSFWPEFQAVTSETPKVLCAFIC